MGGKTLDQLEDISKKVGIETQKLIRLKDLNDEQLSNNFNEKELIKIAQAIGENFDAIFTRE